MKQTHRQLLRLFVTGVVAALPLAATIVVFWWLIDLLLRLLGPDSLIGSFFKLIGIGVTGSEFLGYIIGIALMAGFLVLLGMGVERGLERGLNQVIDAVLSRIPVVRTVYDVAQRIVGLLSQRDEQGARSMSPVWLHFGGPGGAAVLGLLSSPRPVEVRGQRCLAVLVPTAPVPVGGGLLYVPEDWVTPAELGVEALTSIYVSMGVTSAQYLPVAGGVSPAVPGGPTGPASPAAPTATVATAGATPDMPHRDAWPPDVRTFPPAAVAGEAATAAAAEVVAAAVKQAVQPADPAALAAPAAARPPAASSKPVAPPAQAAPVDPVAPAAPAAPQSGRAQPPPSKDA